MVDSEGKNEQVINASPRRLERLIRGVFIHPDTQRSTCQVQSTDDESLYNELLTRLRMEEHAAVLPADEGHRRSNDVVDHS